MNAILALQMLDSIGFSMMELFLSIFWQSMILFAAVAMLAYILRKKSPAVLFYLWLSAVLILPLLPYLTDYMETAGTPQLKISLLPGYSAEDNIALRRSVQDRITVEKLAESKQSIGENGSSRKTGASGHRRTFAFQYVWSTLKIYSRTFPWAFVCIAYSLGFFAFSGLIVIGRRRIRGWIHEGTAVLDADIVGLFERAGERLGLEREFILMECDSIHAPLTCGTLRPAVILPCGFADRLTEEELFSVALHELAHIRRYDVTVLSLVSAVRTVFFFHPLVWIASRQIGHLAEMSCDSLVIEQTRKNLSYADTLTRIAENLLSREYTSELAAGFALSESSFVKRIHAILKKPVGQKLTKPDIAAIAFLAVVALAIAIAFPLGLVNDKAFLKPAGRSGPFGYQEEMAIDTSNTAYAVPLKNIVIDGSLNDWPEDMIEYPVLNFGKHYGPCDTDTADLTTSEDLSPSFMAGYDGEKDLLYLAVKVRDDIVFTFDDQDSRSIFDYPDACEVYLDGLHKARSGLTWSAAALPVLQYVMAANGGIYSHYTQTDDYKRNPYLVAGEIDLTNTKAAYARAGDTTVYEWAIELFDQYPDTRTDLAAGKAVGFDLGIVDRDSKKDNSAWGCWGPPLGLKIAYSGKLGQLVLMKDTSNIGIVKGCVIDKKTKKGAFKQQVDVFFDGKPYANTVTDTNGNFRVHLLAGSYEVRINGNESGNAQHISVTGGAETSADFEIDLSKTEAAM